MRSNNLVILAVAVILGGIAAVLARNWLANHARATQVSVGTIVVASAPLVFGTQLTADNTTEIPWSTAVLPEGAFATKDDLLKSGRRMALALIARNEPVLRGKITAPDQPATLSSMLAPGKRAVTVRVDDVRGVAGFIQPGDLVDVVLIRTEAEMRRSDSFSDVILQSAKVLAIDQITGERTDKPTIAKAVTLEVSPEDAQKILLATNIGHLSLILRQPAEKAAETARRVTERDLGDPPVAPPPPPPAPPPLQVITRPPVQAPPPVSAPVRTKRITIFHGLKEQDYNLPVERASPPVERGLMTQESN
ncbi:MAG TPA: Flp pilus assembly protein CpaB [Xanthobacteraceae bacterium]|jgi:pilus assembly protein CpaB